MTITLRAPGNGAEPVAPVPPGGPVGTRRTRRRLVVLASALLVATVVAVGVFDTVTLVQLDRTQRALDATTSRIDRLRTDQARSSHVLATTTALLGQRRRVLARESGEISMTDLALGSASQTAFFQQLDVSALGTCLTGVSGATTAIATADLPRAVQSLNSASTACLAVDGTAGGPVYPFDFPDPSVLPVGGQYFAFATNSATGNIQIIQSPDLVHWASLGDALPSLPTWAQPGATWAPSVLQRGSTFVLYYSAVFANSTEQCISAAVASQPQGPYVDSSTWPLVCQLPLGGSIDPGTVVAPDGTPYLVWKSQGATGAPATLWSQQLSADGTQLVGAAPSQLLQPDASWQHGYIEGPDLVDVGGQLLLFYSGSDWKTASYAVGYATCAGPLGPCTDRSPRPLLGSGADFVGPGGPSLFTDARGTLWLAFHAWLPGKVGYPNSRPLFLRQVTMTGGVPSVSP